MPDMTVTWAGAVPFEAAYGQDSVGGRQVRADAAAMAGRFDIRPMLDSSTESVFDGAVPYMSDDESEFDWAAEFADAVEQVETPAKKAGRPRKAS